MAPVKFDDLPKTSNEVLSDDYFTAGYQLKAKQKTSFDGAVLSSQVDLFPKGESVVTPAKLTWKLPKPLGCSFFAIDKLEMDKSGGLKLEASTEKAYPKLKFDCKSDLKDASKIFAGLTYTGLADTQLKFETKPLAPQDFTAEVTRAQGPATIGLKYSAASGSPDVGVRFVQGPFFASVLAKGGFKTFAVNGFYKASSDLKCACSYQHGGKTTGNFAVGVSYDVKKGTTIKAKVQQDQSVTVNVKHAVTKGFTVVGGGKYDTAKGSFGYGVQLSIE
eukprot:TRINITY_DN288_c0_g3_i1.p1 TRINITY_DN288_c0_g3~~TRINITY_DN288_c0_g3_i1.p1  ORF type:complete len:294 (+),score=75.67 TRINITY_DN288_c0_g3_i1:57-884(+)